MAKRSRARTAQDVIAAHRSDLETLHRVKQLLMERLLAYLNGEPWPEGVPDPFSRSEGAFDVLEKLSRTQHRLIQLERQAYDLDDETGLGDTPPEVDLSGLSDAVLHQLARALNDSTVTDAKSSPRCRTGSVQA